jgi:hypothetical protein
LKTIRRKFKGNKILETLFMEKMEEGRKEERKGEGRGREKRI